MTSCNTRAWKERKEKTLRRSFKNMSVPGTPLSGLKHRYLCTLCRIILTGSIIKEYRAIRESNLLDLKKRVLTEKIRNQSSLPSSGPRIYTIEWRVASLKKKAPSSHQLRRSSKSIDLVICILTRSIKYIKKTNQSQTLSMSAQI